MEAFLHNQVIDQDAFQVIEIWSVAIMRTFRKVEYGREYTA